MPSLTHTTDALNLANQSLVHTTDALNFGTNSLTHTTDALLGGAGSRTHTTDALLQAENGGVHTTDALLAAEQSLTHTTDGSLAGTNSVTHSTDASLSSGLSRTHTTDALLQAEQTLSHSTDANLQAEISDTHTTDALLVLPVIHTTDALLKAEQNLTHSTDASLKGEQAASHTTDAKIAFVLNLSHFTDAALSAGRQFHTTDAALFEPPEFSVYHTTSALLYEEYVGNGPITLTAFELVGSGSFSLPEPFDPTAQLRAAICRNKNYLHHVWGWGVVDRFEPFSFVPCCRPCQPSIPAAAAPSIAKQEKVQPPGNAKVKHPEVESKVEPPRVLEPFHTPARIPPKPKNPGTVGVSSTVASTPVVEAMVAVAQAPQSVAVEHPPEVRQQFLPKRLRQKDPLVKDSLITQVYRSQRRKRRH